MTGSEQIGPNSFWGDFEEYLRSFYADLSPSTDSGNLRGISFWWRASEGSLHLTSDESRRYHQLLQTCGKQLAPDADISEAAFDSALKEAIFTVADVTRSRTGDVEVRIREAIDGFRSFVTGPRRGYECWVEVEGLDHDSLPASFGDTRFVVLGDAEIDALEALVEEKHTVDKTGKMEHINRLAGEIRGSPIAIQRVNARDDKAALLLAEREVQITIECLNFFADVVPYNRARLRIARGKRSEGNTLQMALADEGSFLYSPQATIPWEFSLDRLRELEGAIGEALERVEELRAKPHRSEVEELRAKPHRSEVDELLLRAVRWVGRAVTANRTEDKLLFAAIALDCIARPKRRHDVRQRLASRAAHVLSGGGEDQERLETEIGRLYDIRSALVHDGSLEVTEDDRAAMQTVALRTVVWALTSSDFGSATTLDELEAYFKRITTASPA